MNIFIVTGTSKGLGESIAKQLLEPGNELVCLSRRRNQSLEQQAEQKGVKLTFYPCDLSKTDEVEATLEKIVTHHDLQKARKVMLINNAGVVEPIKMIGNTKSADLGLNVSVNLMAPMVITNWFISTMAEFNIEKRIVNVSSGAANHPYHGWAAYCSTKAGLDMFTKTVGIEQKTAKYPTKIISFSPGVMDTEMQGQIRSSDEKSFVNVRRFKEFKDKGLLRTTDFVAEKLIHLMRYQEVENGAVYDIKQ